MCSPSACNSHLTHKDSLHLELLLLKHAVPVSVSMVPYLPCGAIDAKWAPKLANQAVTEHVAFWVTLLACFHSRTSFTLELCAWNISVASLPTCFVLS